MSSRCKHCVAISLNALVLLLILETSRVVFSLSATKGLRSHKVQQQYHKVESAAAPFIAGINSLILFACIL